jgi:mannose-6-phosphate isomerase-like protein (cupin superfamily)
MDRRLFLQIPLFASALLSEGKAQGGTTQGKGFKVASGQDHFSEELLIMGGKFDLKVSAKDTGGALCIYDTFREEKGGPALHFHYNQDEWFYVLKGEFIVKIGDDQFNLKPGDSALAPRKIPHAFAKISEGPAQLIILFQPAGAIEDFFFQMHTMGKDIARDMEHTMKDLFHTHGMEIVGPPLKFT